MALFCVPSTSVTKSQNLLTISGEPSLSTISTILLSDTSPEEITFSRLLKKIGPIPKIQRKYLIDKMASLFISKEDNNIEGN
jgi:hypothetical protein